MARLLENGFDVIAAHNSALSGLVAVIPYGRDIARRLVTIVDSGEPIFPLRRDSLAGRPRLKSDWKKWGAYLIGRHGELSWPIRS